MNASNTLSWPADRYAIGAFIQHHLSDLALKKTHFLFYPDDQWLDIGCGDGGYTLKLAMQIPHGKIIGRDPSEAMIAVANQRKKPNTVSFACEDAMRLTDVNSFTVITAFWCMQWINDINEVLKRIYAALKNHGRFFAIYPSSHCLHIRLFRMIQQNPLFSFLKSFKIPAHFPSPTVCEQQAKKLGFASFQSTTIHQRIALPDISIFERFIDGIPFFNNQVPVEKISVLNAAMVDAFKQLCDTEFHGLYFQDEMVVLTGVK